LNAHIYEFDGSTGAGIGVFATDPGMTTPTWASLVPEPTIALLLACGLVGLGVRRRLP
jgi:hypothetical protein